MPFSSTSLSKSNNLKKSLYGLVIQRVNVFKDVSDNKRLGFTAEPAEVIVKQLHKNEDMKSTGYVGRWCGTLRVSQ